MENMINRLFEYFDSIFFEKKVKRDSDELMGAYYDGLLLDYYFENSIYNIDYLSIEDYFKDKADVNYDEEESLFEQYSKLEFDTKIKIISAILTLVDASSFNEHNKELVLNKSISFLKRYGLEIKKEDSKYVISNQYKVNEGTYCNIYSVDTVYYKKQLKDKYRIDKDWKKRFRYEYENMEKLSHSPYILKVFNYDSINDSYIMEKCDCNIYDYIQKNPFLTEDELLYLVKSIIYGMIDVHNAGIIHRDLHLGNILMKENHIILSDFGLSKDTMITHSLKSTATPKNSHYFIDPIGLSDFTKLDKRSDIYSIGKIIDYITKDSGLNKKISFVIIKATERDATKRYQNLKDMIADIEASVNIKNEEERIRRIEANICNGIVSQGVEEYVHKMSEQSLLSSFIVENKLSNFWKIIIKLGVVEQKNILSEIESSYAKATGYGGFKNYDIFANIMYNYILQTNELPLQKIAYLILKGCAAYRFEASNYLKMIEMRFATLRE